MRKSDELPNLETTVEKVNDEFIKNPLVSFKTLFGWGDEDKDEGKSSPAKMSPASEADAAESGESVPVSESAAPAAVPANASVDGE